jgi:ligand-binding SRPBCC domain-containing protein
LGFKIVSINEAKLGLGTLITYKLSIHKIPITWITSIQEWKEGESFVDFQCRGPYRVWHHRHQFHQLKEGVLMTDKIFYRLPLGFLGDLLAGPFVANDVKKIFTHRKKIIRDSFK